MSDQARPGRSTLRSAVAQLTIGVMVALVVLVTCAAVLYVNQESKRTRAALEALSGPLARAVAGDLRSGNLPAIRHTQDVLDAQLGLRMVAIADDDPDPAHPTDLISGRRQDGLSRQGKGAFPSASLVFQDATQRLSLGRLELVRTRSLVYGPIGWGLAGLVLLAIVAYVGVRWTLHRLAKAVVLPLADLADRIRRYAGRDQFSKLEVVKFPESIVEIDDLWNAIEGADSHIQSLRQDWDRQRTTLQSSQLVRQYVHELKNLALVVENPARKIRELISEAPPESLRDDICMELDIIDSVAEALAASPKELLTDNPVLGGRMRDEVVDVLEVVREVEVLARKLGLIDELQLDCDTYGETKVRGDRRVLRLSLMNLVDNSAKYASARRLNLSVLTAGREVVLRYRDGGPGLAPAQVRKFNTGESLGSSQSTGWGTGLASVRRNLLMMGGAALYVPDTEGGTFELRCERALPA